MYLSVHRSLCRLGTRPISLDDEAYERLRAHKREGASFSDVVERLAGERSWQEVAGLWADETADLESAVEVGRRRSRHRRHRIAE